MTYTSLMKRIWRSEAGTVLPIIGLVFFTLIAAAGFSIDYVRAEMARDRLQMALDAGALAGGRVASNCLFSPEVDFEVSCPGLNQQVEAAAQQYFNANFPIEYISGTVHPKIDARIRKEPLSSTRTIDYSFTDSVNVDTILMRVVGKKTVNIDGVVAQVAAQPLEPIEMVFSVDNSGSMAWADGHGNTCRNLTDVNNNPGICRCNPGGGTANLCDTQNPRRDRLFWAQFAIGALHNMLYSDNRTNRFALIPWNHVVNISNFSWEGGARNAAGDDRDTGNARPSWIPNGKPGSAVNGRPAPAPALFLTDDIRAFGDANMAMTPGGNTDSSSGMFWAWMMHAPLYYFKAPGSYRDAYRYAVLMTDGVNTEFWREPNAIDEDDPTLQAKVAQNMNQTCQTMKEHGVTIYTIVYNFPDRSQLNLTENANYLQATKDFQACASNPSFFFHASDRDELMQAFTQIGKGIMTVRLTR